MAALPTHRHDKRPACLNGPSALKAALPGKCWRWYRDNPVLAISTIYCHSNNDLCSPRGPFLKLNDPVGGARAIRP